MVGTKGSNIAPVEQKYQVKIHYPRSEFSLYSSEDLPHFLARTTATTQITVDGPSEEYVLAACLEILDRVTMNQIFKKFFFPTLSLTSTITVSFRTMWLCQKFENGTTRGFLISLHLTKYSSKDVGSWWDLLYKMDILVSAVNIELRAFDNDSLNEGRAVLDYHCGGKQKQPEQQQQQQEAVKPKNRKWKPKNPK